MLSVTWVLALSSVVVSEAGARTEREVERPNVLLIVADDQRRDTIGAWGNAHIRTPHLDRLAARGTSLTGAYCMGSSGGAVCVPSRAMLMTGVPYFGLDLSEFDGRPTLGSLLRAAGYATFATGKWHNGREAFTRSFERGEAVYFGGMADHFAVRLVDVTCGELSPARVGQGHSSELFADAAVAFLGEREGRAEPFFCSVAFTAPHDPRDAPPEWRIPYYVDPPPLPANFAGQHPFDCGWMTVRDEHLAPWPRPADVVRDQLCEYYALISHMDAQIGRILAALEASGHADDTLIVFAADHGLALGSHGLLGKQSLYEHSMGAPVILAGPGVPRGEQRDALVYLFDLFPTVLARCGVDAPALDVALDLGPLLDGEPWPRRSLFTAMGDHARAVRDERYKLMRYPQVDTTRLFDLRSDPDELHDLSRAAEHAPRLAALRRQLEAWQARLGDELAWTAAETRPAQLDLTGTPNRPDRWQPAWIRAKYFAQER